MMTVKTSKYKLSTREFIIEYLKQEGEAYPQQIWRALVKEKKKRGLKPPTLYSFRVYWNDLKKKGIVRPTGRREQVAGRPGFIRVYYSLS